MALEQINEGDQFPFKVRLTVRATDAEVAPSTLRWKLDCLTTGTLDVVPFTAIGAAAVVYGVVPSSKNAIISNVNQVEIKRITVQANYGTDEQVSQFLEYAVLNNSGYT
jgi:hypothetical protein